MVNTLHAAVRDAISTEWWRRIHEQTADTPDGHIDALTDAVMAKLANDQPDPNVIDAHPWQEYNAYGNTCHYPGCRLTEEEHATIVRPALRPGEGQHDCFLADRCVGDPRCQVTSTACAKPVTDPRPYVVNLSTGEVTGGPEPRTVQHYNRETGDLQTHEYAPDSCTRCAELRDMTPHEVTSHDDLARGTRTYVDALGQLHTEPIDR